jgi:uncharacterized membrane protein
MFAPLIFPIFIWLVSKLGNTSKYDWISGIKISVIVVFGLGFISYLIGYGITGISNIIQVGKNQFINTLILGSDQFLGLHGASNGRELLSISFENRLLNPGTWITLLLLVTFIWIILRRSRDSKSDLSQHKPNSDENFVILIILLGAGLALFPEFFYLRDQFSTRMNTIFKFYYQTWILWGIAASYVFILIWHRNSLVMRFVKTVLGLVLLISLAYPTFVLRTTIKSTNLSSLNLDGNSYREMYTPLDYEAILWLQDQPDGTIAEAVGGSYSGYGRMATLTGKPTVLGWVGHELQWRGGATEMGTRESDIRELYETNDWKTAETILDDYSIRYIIIGSYENTAYRVNNLKFNERLPIVFKNQEIVIYEN